ncbi:MAG: hypothetical protein S4CHLAM123_12130 [Chlamydiales bacterium]|nr:hypothetical protein [Chlamydiales bacterium]
MKTYKFYWLITLICVGVYGAFWVYSSIQKNDAFSIDQKKPQIPDAAVVIKEHPWLQLQPFVQKDNPAFYQDLEKIHEISTQIEQYSEQELTLALMETLLELQKEIPFFFPEHLYNVLYIEEPPTDAPAPFHVYKRLYLGESELGIPFYMDVRVFDLNFASKEEIIDWHLGILRGEKSTLENMSGYVIYGLRNEDYKDFSHGFASFLGERGLYLDFIEKENFLYVAYAESSAETFCLFF